MKQIFNFFRTKLFALSILKKSVLLFILGSLSSLSFAPYYILPLILIGLWILMYCLNLATNKKQTALFSFSFGAGLGIFSLKWITNAFLIDGGAFSLFIPFALIGFALFMGIFFMITDLMSFPFKKVTARCLAFSCFFVFF